MLDKIIKGGQVVTLMGAGKWDVGILGEKIVAVCIPDAPLPEAKEVIDATGKIVVPGGIEPHIHAASNVQPGIPESVPGVPNAGPRDHSLGAIWGGVGGALHHLAGAGLEVGGGVGVGLDASGHHDLA